MVGLPSFPGTAPNRAPREHGPTYRPVGREKQYSESLWNSASVLLFVEEEEETTKGEKRRQPGHDPAACFRDRKTVLLNSERNRCGLRECSRRRRDDNGIGTGRSAGGGRA